jgi:hypothetical protein
MTLGSALLKVAAGRRFLAMTVGTDVWFRVLAATEALVFRSDPEDLAKAFDLVRLVPAFEPADLDVAECWLTVTRLAKGSGLSLERALELTHQERKMFAKALFFVLCGLPDAVSGGQPGRTPAADGEQRAVA